MKDEPNLKEKVSILHRNGFLRDQDRGDVARIQARWRLYQTTPQKTVRGKGKAESVKQGNE
jgi:hypothetical protein